MTEAEFLDALVKDRAARAMLAALQAACTHIQQPTKMTQSEVVYDVRNYNTLTAQLRAAIAAARAAGIGEDK